MTNKNLHKAHKAKKDEFYTQLIDIEKELKHYKEQFKNKVVYCNCDDPFESNFFKYFASNFQALQLKSLKNILIQSYVRLIMNFLFLTKKLNGKIIQLKNIMIFLNN